jgi:hypothetical protein
VRPSMRPSIISPVYPPSRRDSPKRTHAYMGTVRTAAWLLAALAVGSPHVTWAGDAGPGKEVRALRHDAPIVLSGRLGNAVSIDTVSVDGNQARVQWHTIAANGTDVFERELGVWVDVQRAAESGQPLLDLTFVPSPGPFTIDARMPTEAESWRNHILHGGGNAYAYFDLRFANDAPLSVTEGTKVRIWLPYLPPLDVIYELTLAKAAVPLDPVYGSIHGSVVDFKLPAFTIPPHAELIGELDGN